MLISYNNNIEQMITVLQSMIKLGYTELDVELSETLNHKDEHEAKLTLFPVEANGKAYKPYAPRPKRRKNYIDPNTDLYSLLENPSI